jgi:hypothetical protein
LSGINLPKSINVQCAKHGPEGKIQGCIL